MGKHRDILQGLAGPTRALRAEVPDAWSAFRDLHHAAMADGAVSAALKEATALAIAVALRCDGCVAAHSRSAVRAGATRQQVAELLAVALLMQGGPASMYAPRALEAFDEFAAQAAETVP